MTKRCSDHPRNPTLSVSAYGHRTDTPTNSRGVGGFVEVLAKADDKTFDAFEKELFEKVRPTSLIKRFEEPEEIAAMVAFIAARCHRARPVRL